MNNYQLPPTPQPALSFGDGEYTESWATTMLQNTCNNFQVQNMALQQENAALKTKTNLYNSRGQISFQKQLIALTCGSLVPIEQSIL